MSTPIKQFRIVGKKGKIVKSTAQTKPARKTRKATKTSKLKLGPKLQREVTQAKRALSRIQSVRAQLSQDETVANPRPLNSTDIRFSNDIILLRDQLNNLIVELNQKLEPRQQMTLSSVLAKYGVSPVRPTFAELQSVFNNLIEQRDAQQSLEASKELLQLKREQIEKGKDASLVPKIASGKKLAGKRKKASTVDILPPPAAFRDLPPPPLPSGGHSGLDVTVEEMREPVPYDFVVPPRPRDLPTPSEERKLSLKKLEEVEAKKAQESLKRLKSTIEESKQLRKRLGRKTKPAKTKPGKTPKPPITPKPEGSKIKAERDAAWERYLLTPQGNPEGTQALKEYIQLARKLRALRSITPIAPPIFESTPASIPAVTRREIVPDDSGIMRSPIAPGASYEDMTDDSGILVSPTVISKSTKSREPSKLSQYVQTAQAAQAGEGFIVPYSAKRVKNLRTAMGHAERGHFAKALRLIHTQRKMVRDPTHQAEMYVHSLMEN